MLLEVRDLVPNMYDLTMYHVLFIYDFYNVLFCFCAVIFLVPNGENAESGLGSPLITIN